MLKQILPILILTIGIYAAVFLIQNSTQLRSKAYELMEFVPSFHSKEGESSFNNNLDIYKDGIINAFDIIADRYLNQASKSATPSAEASKSAEASSSASPVVSPPPIPSPSPSPSPVQNQMSEYQRILNNTNKNSTGR
jgi:hypothetical protein